MGKEERKGGRCEGVNSGRMRIEIAFLVSHLRRFLFVVAPTHGLRRAGVPGSRWFCASWGGVG